MPEGDVVWRTAHQLDEALAGRVLRRSDFRVPRFATTDLAGRAVTGTVSRGKHLLTRVDGGITVHTHLRMDGSWRIRPASSYPPRDHRIRLVLGNDERQALGYLLGVVEVLPSQHEERVVGHLGPDLLGPDWDAAEAVRRLRADPDRPIAEALLDQRNLAGIGNLYKAEVLFLRGIDPWRPVGGIDDLTALVELARQLLDTNKARIDQVTTGSLIPGQQTWVYGRGGRACRRCGGRVRRISLAGHDGPPTERGRPLAGHDGPPNERGRSPAGRGGESGRGRLGDADERVTFWCPHCQPTGQ
jgi:endonuclease VIII